MEKFPLKKTQKLTGQFCHNKGLKGHIMMGRRGRNMVLLKTSQHSNLQLGGISQGVSPCKGICALHQASQSLGAMSKRQAPKTFDFENQ